MDARHLRAVGMVVVGALVLGVPVTATAASAPVLPAVQGEGEPSDDAVQAALDRAVATRHEATARAHTVVQARQVLDAAARDSAVALEAYELAARARDDAERRRTAADAALRGAEARVVARQAELARWVRAAYVEGGAFGLSPAVRTLLSGGSTDDAASTTTVLERVGLDRATAVQALTLALAAQRRATADADAAAAAADAAAARAGAASRARDGVLADHEARLVDLEAQLLTAKQDARAAQGGLERLQRAWTSGVRVEGVAGPGTADCPGGDVSGYLNGRLPTDRLCPVWHAPGELLRADAAAAFGRLSAAYADATGSPLCVEDAYRSFVDQVRVKAERGSWAATPGRSNHGWGTAVDLCGGAESFSSQVTGWLRLHAPLYGWFHPAWAEPAGTLPEPWHWEFAGG